MLPLERRNKIIEHIQERSTVKVIELSKLFSVTEETIRKDLEKLEKQGVLKRSYGGAILVEEMETKEIKEGEDTPFSIRSREHIEAKNKMGKTIAGMFKEGEIVILDSSTTCLEVAKNIESNKKITIITNGISIVLQMSNNEQATVLSTGGTLRSRSLSFIGPTAKSNIKNYYADKAVISCKGVDDKRGIMDSNELETEIKRAMIGCAKEVILAVNSTKLGKASLYKVIDLEKIDYLITDKMPSEKWVELCEKFSIKLIVAS